MIIAINQVIFLSPRDSEDRGCISKLCISSDKGGDIDALKLCQLKKRYSKDVIEFVTTIDSQSILHCTSSRNHSLAHLVRIGICKVVFQCLLNDPRSLFIP